MRFLVLYLFLSLPLSSAEPFLVAHRGASADAPENTLPAFNLAWKQGANAIEGDALSTNPWPDLDQSFLTRLREAGCTHHVWTVNDAPTARKFLSLGSSSITTDRPGALRRELNP